MALAAGVAPGRIGFHGNNKSVAEIDQATRVGVGTIIIDSPIEIDRVAAAALRHGIVMSQIERRRVHFGEVEAHENPDEDVLHHAMLARMIAD